jgi:multidrug efflux pump subunit AcrA (membrane-fusion protein)
MALFKKRSPMEKSQKHLAELRSRAAALADKRMAAEAALAEAMTARQRHMLEGDLADDRSAEKLQASVDSCGSRLAGLSSALEAVQAQIADTKQQIAAEHLAIQRAAAADKLAQQVTAIDAALPKFVSASSALSDALSALGHWHFESSQMSSFILNATAQIELASGFSLAELRATVDRIKTGDAPIPREPDAEPTTMVEPPPKTMTVWLVQSAKFRDHTGVARLARQYDDAQMPIETAQLALRLGVAVPLTDPRRRNLKGARGGDHVDPRAPDIIDLDADSAMMPTVNVESNPVLAAADFKVIDRSAENRKLEIEVPRI